MVLFGQHLTKIALAHTAGGIVTSLIVWLLARRTGLNFPADYRYRHPRDVSRLNTLLLLQASLETALTAGLWNAGVAQRSDMGKTRLRRR